MVPLYSKSIFKNQDNGKLWIIKVFDKMKVLFRGCYCYLDSHDTIQDIFRENYTILVHVTYSYHVQITCLSVVYQNQVDNLCVVCLISLHLDDWNMTLDGLKIVEIIYRVRRSDAEQELKQTFLFKMEQMCDSVWKLLRTATFLSCALSVFLYSYLHPLPPTHLHAHALTQTQSNHILATSQIPPLLFHPSGSHKSKSIVTVPNYMNCSIDLSCCMKAWNKKIWAWCIHLGSLKK